MYYAQYTERWLSCAVKCLDFLKEYVDPDTDEQKYMQQLVSQVCAEVLACSL